MIPEKINEKYHNVLRCMPSGAIINLGTTINIQVNSYYMKKESIFYVPYFQL